MVLSKTKGCVAKSPIRNCTGSSPKTSLRVFCVLPVMLFSALILLHFCSRRPWNIRQLHLTHQKEALKELFSGLRGKELKSNSTKRSLVGHHSRNLVSGLLLSYLPAIPKTFLRDFFSQNCKWAITNVSITSSKGLPEWGSTGFARNYLRWASPMLEASLWRPQTGLTWKIC